MDARAKKPVDGIPRIVSLDPAAALPGGEVRINGTSLRPTDLVRPTVLFNDTEGSVVVGSNSFVVARVPEDASSGPVAVEVGGESSNALDLRIGVAIAENLHPVANPVVDLEGNVYATFSGPRGEKVPVAVYKVDTNYNMRPFVTDLMNATAMALDREGFLYVSSRFEGTVYRVSPSGTVSTYAEGMGVATGLAFDREENLYVGDRSGTIFKIGRSNRETFVFATLEPSVAAYHLAFGPGGNLYVTGPTTSSYDAVYEIDPHGAVTVYYRGLGRPQGHAFDADGNMYVVASLRGRRGVVKITPEHEASLVVAGQNLVGLAFAPGRAAVLATSGELYHLSWNIEGAPLITSH